MQSLVTSKELFLNSRMSFSLEAIKLLLLEIKDNNWTEDYFSLSMRLKDFSREESIFQSRIQKEDIGPWIIPESLTKKKTKSLNCKRKSKTWRKDLEELPRERLNLRMKS